MSIETTSVAETQALGRALGGALRLGDVVALMGPLGSGKTTFVKGVADGAGVADLRQVNSPTFVIVNEYDADNGDADPQQAARDDAARAGEASDLTGTLADRSPLHMYHIDTYRLGGAEELDDLGFDEMCRTGAVLIEWAERVAELLPADHLRVLIEPIDDHRRRFDGQAVGTLSARLLEALENWRAADR